MEQIQPKRKHKGTDWRCSFNRLFSILKNPNVTQNHIDACESSPFHELFKGLYNLAANAPIEKSDEMTHNVITYFNSAEDGFKLPKEFGGKFLYLTVQDIKVMFAIRCGDDSIGKKEFTTLKDIYFPGGKRELGSTRIRDVIEQMLAEDNDRKEKRLGDFAKLLTLLALSSIFFGSKGEYVPTRYVGYVDNMNEICNYDWATEIHEDLLKSLRNTSNPTKVDLSMKPKQSVRSSMHIFRSCKRSMRRRMPE